MHLANVIVFALFFEFGRCIEQQINVFKGSLKGRVNFKKSEPVKTQETSAQETSDSCDPTQYDSTQYNYYEYPRFGLRVDARNLTKSCFQKLYNGKRPVVLTNVYLSERFKDALSIHVMEKLGECDVEYDVRESATGNIDSYEATLKEFLSTLPENSDHDDSMYLMNEDILNNDINIENIIRLPETLFGKDLLQHFPSVIRPRSALVAGGVGARSFLHADPYEWMGINYLMEGKKLWTFFPPDVSADIFRARRNAPDAWGSYNLSAGYVSDIDLYRHMVFPSSHVLLSNISIPGSINMLWSQVLQTQENFKKYAEKQLGSFNNSAYDEKSIISTASTADPSLQQQYQQILQRDNIQVPVFLSGDQSIDETEDLTLLRGAIQIVQHEGEMVLIPPFFWHQVYTLEPSLGFASQYVNEGTAEQLYSHILHWTDKGEWGGREREVQKGQSENTRHEVRNDGNGEGSDEGICTGLESGCIANAAFSSLNPVNSSYALHYKVHPFLHSNTFKSKKGEKSRLRAVLKHSLLSQHGHRKGNQLIEQLELHTDEDKSSKAKGE